MVILLTGATGFLGTRLSAALQAAGHVVVLTKRQDVVPPELQADFSRDHDPDLWVQRLRGIDAVVNAVGIIRERTGQSFEAIHTLAPQALFAACVRAGIGRIVQISALGADCGSTPYFTSKHRADAFLAALPLDWIIVQPSLLYGPDGNSARLFTLLASLPLIPLPGSGQQAIQPIHIDDAVEAIVRLFDRGAPSRQTIPLVGNESIALRAFLGTLRRAMRLGEPHFVSMPAIAMRAAAYAGEITGLGLLTRDTLEMLQAGNTADATATRRLLQRPLRTPEEFIPPSQADATAVRASLSWLLPVLRTALALMWIWTGTVSLGLYPTDASYALLHRVHAPAALAPVLLYGAALLDLAIGIGLLVLRRRSWLWLTQLTLILIYTAIITVALPEFWLHPYGPVLKNLPVLAAILVLWQLERIPQR